jgi:hypothetical protein
MFPRRSVLVENAFSEKCVEGISPWAKAKFFEARRKHHLDVLRVYGDETSVSEECLLDVGSQSIIKVGKQSKESFVPVCLEA